MSAFNRTIIAGFFYTGYAPVAPGTVGSLAACILLWLLPTPELWIWCGALAVFFLISVAAADRVARDVGPDPSIVVIDEAMGMAIAVTLAPKTWLWWGLAFLLFRILDIWKPWPCRRLERFPGGWGIVLDDVGAGVYTCLAIQGVLLITSG